jgi:hypothetical protein
MNATTSGRVLTAPRAISVRLAGERVHGIGYGAEALEGGLVD